MRLVRFVCSRRFLFSLASVLLRPSLCPDQGHGSLATHLHAPCPRRSSRRLAALARRAPLPVGFSSSSAAHSPCSPRSGSSVPRPPRLSLFSISLTMATKCACSLLTVRRHETDSVSSCSQACASPDAVALPAKPSRRPPSHLHPAHSPRGPARPHRSCRRARPPRAARQSRARRRADDLDDGRGCKDAALLVPRRARRARAQGAQEGHGHRARGRGRQGGQGRGGRREDGAATGAHPLSPPSLALSEPR